MAGKKSAKVPLPGAILPFYYRGGGLLWQYVFEEHGGIGRIQTKSDAGNKPARPRVKGWEEGGYINTCKTCTALYMRVTAQASAGSNGLHNLRMPFKQIDSVIHMAHSINAQSFSWTFRLASALYKQKYHGLKNTCG